MLFLMTLVGFSNLSSGEILDGLSLILPKKILKLTQSTIKEVSDNQYTRIIRTIYSIDDVDSILCVKSYN